MRRPLPLAAALFAASCCLTGCDRGPTIVPVSGVVLIDGKPLTKGTVQVMPAGYRPAAGTIGPDGRFTLGTNTDVDGCVLGTHPARVVGNENVGTSDIRWLAPKKYAIPEESGLTVKIDGPTTDLKIELTWAGGSPFIDRGSEGGQEGPQPQ